MRCSEPVPITVRLEVLTHLRHLAAVGVAILVLVLVGLLVLGSKLVVHDFLQKINVDRRIDSESLEGGLYP